MEHIISTRTIKDSDTPSRTIIGRTVLDGLSLLFRKKVTPCFSSITLHTYADKTGRYPGLTYYSVNGKEIPIEKGEEIRNIIGNKKMRNYSGATEEGEYDEETLFPESITNQATLLEINTIVREAMLQAENKTSGSEKIQ